MDPEEQARRQIEEELEQIGRDIGGYEGVCITNLDEIRCVYEDAEGNQHLFTFAPLENRVS